MNTQFGRNTSLTNATVTDLRNVLFDAFADCDFFALGMLTSQWERRCLEGHAAASRILPMIQRAKVALDLAKNGQDYAFEG